MLFPNTDPSLKRTKRFFFLIKVLTAPSGRSMSKLASWTSLFENKMGFFRKFPPENGCGRANQLWCNSLGTTKDFQSKTKCQIFLSRRLCSQPIKRLLGEFGSTQEAWVALGIPAPFKCSQYFPRAYVIRYTHVKHAPILIDVDFVL